MFAPYKSVDHVKKYFPALYGDSSDNRIDRYKNLFEVFKKSFSVDCAYFASSPGRVEVCGNHTDHNGGRVISCTISLDTIAAFLPTDNGVITVRSNGYNDICINVDNANREEIGTSAALIQGVVVGLKNYGYRVGGFIASVDSNVLGGAGISSSAAFELLIVEILSFLYNDSKIKNEEKAKIAQFSESEFFGKPCGLLDQTAIAFGGLNKLDFSNIDKIEVEKINSDLNGYSFVLINTGGSHANLTGEYASIPAEMFSVAKLFGKKRLIEVPENEFYDKLPDLVGKVTDRAILRAIHFYSENERVDIIAKALPKGDISAFLTAVNNSGISSAIKLQNCKVEGQSEQLILRALSVSEKFLFGGANRVHGGGFAGTVLCVIKNQKLDFFIEKMSAFYEKLNIIPLKVRSVGTTVL